MEHFWGKVHTAQSGQALDYFHFLIEIQMQNLKRFTSWALCIFTSPIIKWGQYGRIQEEPFAEPTLNLSQWVACLFVFLFFRITRVNFPSLLPCLQLLQRWVCAVLACAHSWIANEASCKIPCISQIQACIKLPHLQVGTEVLPLIIYGCVLLHKNCFILKPWKCCLSKISFCSLTPKKAESYMLYLFLGSFTSRSAWKHGNIHFQECGIDISIDCYNRTEGKMCHSSLSRGHNLSFLCLLCYKGYFFFFLCKTEAKAGQAEKAV